MIRFLFFNFSVDIANVFPNAIEPDTIIQESSNKIKARRSWTRMDRLEASGSLMYNVVLDQLARSKIKLLLPSR